MTYEGKIHFFDIPCRGVQGHFFTTHFLETHSEYFISLSCNMESNMTYLIDSRPCGKGKTIHGIYSLIKKYLLLEQKIILIVPSIDLQYQYKEKYGEKMTIINSSDSSETTTKRLVHAMGTGVPFICITRQTLLLSPTLPNKKLYNFISDESLDSLFIELSVPMYDKNNLVKYFWHNHFEVSEDFVNDGKNNVFYKLELIANSSDNISMSSWEYKKITNPNYEWYISSFDYQIMTSQIQRKYFKVFGLAKADVVTGWKSTYTAAAAFHTTTMHWWLKHCNIHSKVIPEGDFTKHSFNNLHIHYGDIPLWSKSKQQSQNNGMDSVEKQFHDYVTDIVLTDDIITLRNWEHKGNKFLGEINVNHNVHGMNTTRLLNCKNICLESALNPSQQLYAFLKTILLNSVADHETPIRHMFIGNLFYQIVMRSILRSNAYNDEVVNIFIMDRTACALLHEYFQNAVLHPITLYMNSTKNKDKLEKKELQLEELKAKCEGRAMTDAERQYKVRLLRSINKIRNLTK